jgi:hypothetical protein
VRASSRCPTEDPGRSVVKLTYINFSQNVEGIVLSTTVHIILIASSGVAAKLRIGSQPISSKLMDKLGEQATPTDPGSIRKRYP